MIVTEKIDINSKAFIRTYSDKGMKIEREGVPYDEAIDLAEFCRTYEEVCESHCVEIGLGEIV